jgi:hypothetical protein
MVVAAGKGTGPGQGYLDWRPHKVYPGLAAWFDRYGGSGPPEEV